MSEPVADLDDFFAKKDRKKSKKKFPAVPAELRELTTSVPAAPPKKVEPTPSTNSTGQEGKDDEGNEWLDYKEEQEKDYSGLKLKQLEEALPEPEPEEDQSQEVNTASAEPAWKAVDTPAPTPAPTVAAAATNEPQKSVYISPALRNAAVLAPTKMGKASKAAPDLANDTYFPALGAEPPKPVVVGKLQPSRLGPQRSAWGQPAGSAQQQQGVSLGNRFNTLDNEDS